MTQPHFIKGRYSKPSTVCFKCASSGALLEGHMVCESCHVPELCPRCSPPRVNSSDWAGTVHYGRKGVRPWG